MNECGTIYRFGEYELCPETRDLLRNGKRVEIQERIFCLLAYLVENSDRAITKDELIASVWEGRPMSATVIPRAIMKARRAIGDDGDPPSMIRTIHGYGYRFMAEPEVAFCPALQSCEGPVAKGADTEEITIGEQPETRSDATRPGRRLLHAAWNGSRPFALVAALLVAGIFLGYYLHSVLYIDNNRTLLGRKGETPRPVFALKLSPVVSGNEHSQEMTTRVTALLAHKLANISWIETIYFSAEDGTGTRDNEPCILGFSITQAGTKYRIEYTLRMQDTDTLTGTLVGRNPVLIVDDLIAVVTSIKMASAGYEIRDQFDGHEMHPSRRKPRVAQRLPASN